MIVTRTLQALLILGLLFSVSCGTGSVTETASTAESQGTKTTAATENTEVTAPPEPPAATSTTSPQKPATTGSTKADSPANTTASSQGGIYFPTQKSQERGVMEARGAGRLILTDNGCLRLGSGGDYPSDLIIWPPGYSLNIEGNRVRIINENGQVAAEVGDEIVSGGGQIVAARSRDELSSRDLAAIPDYLQRELPERCPPPYRLAGSEVEVLSE